MVNILALILVALAVILCSLLAIVNAISRRRQQKGPGISPANLELLKEQGLISSEELESLKEGKSQLQELPVESCTLSLAEVMGVMEAAIASAADLETDQSYTGDAKWAEVLGIRSPLAFNLKELTILSMKIERPRASIELMAEILAMNIPIDALEAAQSRGKSAFPNYKVMARVIWVKVKERLSEPISALKEVHEQKKRSDQRLVIDLMLMIMKALRVPVSAAGFAVILALMIAKTDFSAFSGESENY